MIHPDRRASHAQIVHEGSGSVGEVQRLQGHQGLPGLQGPQPEVLMWHLGCARRCEPRWREMPSLQVTNRRRQSVPPV